MLAQTFSKEQIASANERLAFQRPEAILRWAVDTFHPRLTMESIQISTLGRWMTDKNIGSLFTYPQVLSIS